MKFRIEHNFDGITLEQYEKLYFDEPFNEEMCKFIKLGRDLKKRDLKDGKLTRVVVVAPERELPKPLVKVLGGNKVGYTEYIDYVWGKMKGGWRSDSMVMADKIESSGNFGFEKKGKGVMRWVDGEIKVKIFGLGSAIEKMIVNEIEKSYNASAEFTVKHLAKNGPPSV